MLSVQTMHGLPRLRAPGIVPCKSLSPRNSLDSSWYDDSILTFLVWICLSVSFFTIALLRTYSFIFFSVHETRRIFLSAFISKASRRVSSLFLCVQLSQPYVATGHSNAFISRIFDMLWRFHIFHFFRSDAPIAWVLFNLVRNSVVHSPSSVIRDGRNGNVSTCSSFSFWTSMQHAMPSLAITLVLSTLMSRLYLRLTLSGRSTSSCSSAYE